MLRLKILSLKDVRVHLTHILPTMIFLFVFCFFLCGSSSSELPNKELLSLLTDVEVVVVVVQEVEVGGEREGMGSGLGKLIFSVRIWEWEKEFSVGT